MNKVPVVHSRTGRVDLALILRGVAQVAILGVWLGGCAATQYNARLPEAKPQTSDRVPLVKVMEQMDNRRNAVATVKSALNVVLRDEVKGKDYHLSGAYLGDNAGNLRLRLKYEEMLVMDLAFHGASVELSLPRKNRFFRGTRLDAMNSACDELALLAHVGNAHDLFFPRAWSPKAIERRVKLEGNQEVVSILERRGTVASRCARRFWISPTQPVADKIEVFNSNGQALGVIRYDDYRFPEALASDDPSVPKQIVYPSTVTLVSKSGNRSLELDLQALHLNQSIESKCFEGTLPDGAKVLDLRSDLTDEKGPFD